MGTCSSPYLAFDVEISQHQNGAGLVDIATCAQHTSQEECTTQSLFVNPKVNCKWTKNKYENPQTVKPYNMFAGKVERFKMITCPQGMHVTKWCAGGEGSDCKDSNHNYQNASYTVYPLIPVN